MPLSISNSDEAAANAWALRRTWLLALLTFIALCGVSEWFWRSRGHAPSVSDTIDFWAWHRAHVYRPNAMVLLGTSRGQSGFHHDVLEERLPGRPVIQLCVAGDSPVATLDDLSRDASFRGDILCDIAEPFIEQRQWDEQLPYVHGYRRTPTLLPRLEHAICASLECRLTFLHPGLTLPSVIEQAFQEHALPEPCIRNVRFDRFRPMHMSNSAVARKKRYLIRVARKRFDGYTPDYNKWREGTDKIGHMVERLHARGCRVVFIRFPTSGARVPFESKAYPRDRFWDTFAADVPAPCIHFRDDRRLARFTCYDMSHLDERDARRFTQRLLDILDDRELLDRTPPRLADDTHGRSRPAARP